MADAPVVEAPLDDVSPLGHRKRPAEGGYTETRKLQATSTDARSERSSDGMDYGLRVGQSAVKNHPTLNAHKRDISVYALQRWWLVCAVVLPPQSSQLNQGKFAPCSSAQVVCQNRSPILNYIQNRPPY